MTLLGGACWAQAPAGVKPEQLQTAQRVAQQGVALADLAPNAPESHTVRPGDTLWGLSQLFLKSPLRWAELWGMNLEQVRNPHRIYPGQVLVLFKSGDRATLKLAQPVATEAPPATVKLLPRVRSSAIEAEAIASVPAHLIAPFMTDSTVLAAGEIDGAPRIVRKITRFARGAKCVVFGASGCSSAPNTGRCASPAKASQPKPHENVFRISRRVNSGVIESQLWS